MTWSTFTAYLTANAKHIPAGVFTAAKREGLARYVERMQAGRADAALTFDDIVRRCEASIAGDRA